MGQAASLSDYPPARLWDRLLLYLTIVLWDRLLLYLGFCIRQPSLGQIASLSRLLYSAAISGTDCFSMPPFSCGFCIRPSAIGHFPVALGCLSQMALVFGHRPFSCGSWLYLALVFGHQPFSCGSWLSYSCSSGLLYSVWLLYSATFKWFLYSAIVVWPFPVKFQDKRRSELLDISNRA